MRGVSGWGIEISVRSVEGEMKCDNIECVADERHGMIIISCPACSYEKNVYWDNGKLVWKTINKGSFLHKHSSRVIAKTPPQKDSRLDVFEDFLHDRGDL